MITNLSSVATASRVMFVMRTLEIGTFILQILKTLHTEPDARASIVFHGGVSLCACKKHYDIGTC